jgi:recombinational DNA repair protein (RecF pathway)
VSYQTYTTEAIVCGSFINNTADKSFLLFTKTAGMVYASARSVREERSRQRYALQDFSLVTVSLIKGKTGWRIGSVVTSGNLFKAAESRGARGSVVRLFKLLRRFLQGEDAHATLFDEILIALSYVAQADLPDRVVIEEIITARVLYELGYVSASETLSALLTDPLLIALQRADPSQLSHLRATTTAATTASQL